MCFCSSQMFLLPLVHLVLVFCYGVSIGVSLNWWAQLAAIALGLDAYSCFVMWFKCEAHVAVETSRKTNKAQLFIFFIPLAFMPKSPSFSFWSQLRFVVLLQSFVFWLCQGPCFLISEKCQITSGYWKSMHFARIDACESGILRCLFMCSRHFDAF